MGNDHASRNAAKKFKKRQRQELGRDGKPTRDRKKRKGPRRLCRGVCYNSPVLSEKDKKWNGQPDYEDEEDDVEDKVMEAVVNDASSTKKKNNKKRKVDDDEDNTNDAEPRMSTEVKLLDSQILLSQAKVKTLSKLPSGASVAALEPYHPLIQTCMLSQGFVEPTPIQVACWNLAVAGKDVLGVAEPGSGKTLAYLLPGFVKLSNSKTSSSAESVQDVVQGPRMLVVLPTRELVMQVSTVCRGFRGSTGLRVAHLYGGVPRESQIAQLITNPDVIVATPGRLLDLFDTGDLRLDNMSYVVLDESDKMLSLGFKPQIERLHNILVRSVKISQEEEVLSAQSLKKVRREIDEDEKKTKAVGGPSTLPQIMLFTATLPEDIVSTSAAWQRSGENLEVVNITTSSAAVSSTVTQTVHVCAEHKKLAKLLKHLTKIKEQGATLRNPPRVLIFCNRVKAVRFLCDALGKESFRPVMLHGQRSQAEREAAIKDFRSGKAQIMVATDVAARGLDVRALPYVINYDFPSRLETYIHRIGRTGRLAAYGHAYSFFTRNLAKLAKPLQDLLVAHKQKVDPNLISVAEEWLAEEAEMRSATELLKIDASGSVTDDKEKDDGEEDEDGELKEDASRENVKKTKKEVSLDDESTVANLPEDLLEGLGLPRMEDSNGGQKLINGKEEGEGLEAGARKKKGMKTMEVLNMNDELVEKPLRVVPKLDLSVDPQSKQQRKKARFLGVDELLVPSKQEPAEENKDVNEAVEDTSSTGKKKKVKEVAGANKNASGNGKDLSTSSIPLVAAFLPAKKFEGSKPGMVFKMDKLGLGYYRDELQMAKLKAQVVAANEPAPSPALKAALKKAEATANAAAAAAAMAVKKAAASVNASAAVTAKVKSVKKGKDSGEKKEETVAAISTPPATVKVVPATSIENTKNKGKENGASSIGIAQKKKGLVAPVVDRNKPIVPAHTGDSDYGSDDGSDGDDGWGALAAEAKNLSGSKGGERGEKNGKSQKKKNNVKQSDSDSDDDSGASKAKGNKKKKIMKGGEGRIRGRIVMKKKAVPGRLRKALAKRSSAV